MASLDFFAVREDHKEILDYVFDQTDARCFELYSEFDQDLREFRSFDELAAAYDVGIDTRGSVLLALWSPSVMDKLEIKKIEMTPKRADGHKFRSSIEGFGVVALYLGGVRDKAIVKSEYGHNSPERARKWGYKSGVDWEALKKLSNKIQYQIRRRMAVANLPGRPIMPAAFDLVKAGYTLKEMAQFDWHHDPALVKVVAGRTRRCT